jgi:hypothetical protein
VLDTTRGQRDLLCATGLGAGRSGQGGRMSYENRPANPDPVGPDESGARTAGRGLLWLVIAIAIVVVLVGTLLIGPFGLIIVVPALLVIWLVSSAASGGPAAGA